MTVGRGSVLAKMDIKQAYRNVPVYPPPPQDRLLLGMYWNDAVYVDATLPFGLRSAPLIFSALADAVLWGMQQSGVKCVFHYLDDYITVAAPGTGEYERNMQTMHELCQDLGLPVAKEKDEGPTTSLQFLGLVLDTRAMEIRLSHLKLVQLQVTLEAWRGREKPVKNENYCH